MNTEGHMIYLELFWVFFFINVLGYGGGPGTIPLLQHEVVTNFQWLTESEFTEALAMGNSLPGAIATKMSAYIGYSQAGLAGAFVATLATVAPSVTLMLSLMGLLTKHKDSPKVKRLTRYVRPAIAVLLGLITIDMFSATLNDPASLQLMLLAAISFVLMKRMKVHPALVVLGALAYGSTILAN